MVADHQGGGYQGRVNLSHCANGIPVEVLRAIAEVMRCDRRGDPPMACRSSFAIVAFAGLFSATAAGAQDFLLKYPDIVSQWRRPPEVGIQWDQSKRVGRARQAPLTPEYQTRFEASMADQAAGGQGANAVSQCLPPGMPRMMTLVFPMEIIITPKVTYILIDYTEGRRIYTDGRDWPKELQPTFNGYSIGKWIDEDGDGRYDVLEVETRGFKGP